MAFRIECRPAPNYAREAHRVVLNPGSGATFESASQCLELACRAPLEIRGDGAHAEITLQEGETLTRPGRHDRARLNEARLLFEQMLGYANHLGLYAEETGPHGEAPGNFPQAFTHLALISAAFNLDRGLGRNR
jgi:hypothetical protein